MWSYGKDLAERVFWTFAQGVAGTVTAVQFDLINPEGWKMAAVSALPAAYAVLKGGIAKFVGDRSTAALAPKQNAG